MTYNLAVILPSPYSGGVIRSLVNICRMLVIGARECGDDLRLVVGLPKAQAWSAQNAEIFAELGIQTRTFEQKVMARESLTASYACLGVDVLDITPSETIYFDDGIANFEDVDFWYLISDAVQGALPAHRKYACMIYDYANRYVPEIFSEEQWKSFHWRSSITERAKFVVTTTQQARRDVINFAGAAPNRVNVFPLEFDPIDTSGLDCDLALMPELDGGRFVLWPTIISGHENHAAVVQGLEAFLSESDVKVVIIGKGTSSFDPDNKKPLVQHPYVESVRNLIAASRLLKERLVFMDFVSDEVLLVLMRKAFCVLHSSRGDNGTYTVVEAAWQGTPSLSNRYPAMEDVGDYFSLPLSFFDFYRPGSLAEGLRRVTREHTELCARLPTQEQLRHFSYESIASRYWQLFSAGMCAAMEQN